MSHSTAPAPTDTHPPHANGPAPRPAPRGGPLPATLPTARADARTLQYDEQRTITLPCGRRVAVTPLDGECQRRLTPNVEGKLDNPNGAITDVLARVVKTVDGVRYPQDRMHQIVRAWPTGSRMRAFAWARTLTYGSSCVLEWECACGKKCTHEVHLDEIADVAYDPGVLAHGLEVRFRTSVGRLVHARLGVETGITADAFARAVATDKLSQLQSAIAQVRELNGAGPRNTTPAGTAEFLASITAQPGDVVDELGAIARLMEPRTFLDGERERAWTAKARERACGMQLEVNGVPVTDSGGSGDSTEGGSAEGEGAEGEAEGADGGTRALVSPVPQGGMRTRVQVRCEDCGRPSWTSVEAAPDFFFRHLRRVAEED